jgi:heat shock protein HtpX
MNGLKTTLLLALMSSVFLVGGQLVGGRRGMMFGLFIAIGMNFFSYFFSEKLALSMYSAQPLSPASHREAFARVSPMVIALCDKMLLPLPRLWLIPDPSPNAFATGRNPQHSSVCLTEGLLALMDDKELEGVIAHELGHVKNRDILTSSVAATIASAITMLAQTALFFGGRGSDDEDRSPMTALLMLLLAPVAAGLIQMAISRTREYSADASAAKYAGSPNGLISALDKLENWSKRIPMDASPATAHMFIVKPLAAGGISRLFSTHPSTKDRIEHLRALA